ncbi:MAG: hypothetical protein ABI231_05920 [Candidatus Tumulicola sp.]
MLDLQTSNRLRELIEDDVAKASQPLRVLSAAAGLSEQRIYAVIGDRKKPLSVDNARAILAAESVERIIDLAEFADRWNRIREEAPLPDNIFSPAAPIIQEVRRLTKRGVKVKADGTLERTPPRVHMNAATRKTVFAAIERGVRKAGLVFPEPDPTLEGKFGELFRSYTAAVDKARQKRDGARRNVR